MGDGVHGTIGAIYSAAMNPAGWPATLKMIAAGARAQHAMIGPAWGEDRAVSQVFDSESAFSTAMRALGRGRDALYDRLATDRSAVFNEAEAPHTAPSLPGWKRYGFTVEPTPGHVVALMLARPDDGSTVGEAEIASLPVLRGHLQRAAALHGDRPVSPRLPSQFEHLLDSMNFGAALVNGRGRVAHANRRLVEMTSAVTLERGILKAAHPDDQAALDTVIASAFVQSAAGTRPAPVPLRGHRPLRPFLVHSVALPHDPEPNPLWRALDRQRALVLIADPGHARSGNREPALRLLGLTRMEARVAAMIAEGESPEAIARTCGIEPSTVRVHLKRIYAKLDVSGQLELAVLLARLSNPLGDAVPPQRRDARDPTQPLWIQNLAEQRPSS
jgi:DNA-binding CsgD family transcriptional regulator